MPFGDGGGEGLRFVEDLVSATLSKMSSRNRPSVSDSSSDSEDDDFFLKGFASLLDGGVAGGVGFSSGKHLNTTTSIVPMNSPSRGAR